MPIWFTGSLINTFFVELQDHIAQCSKFPVSCPNNCGCSIPRELVRLLTFVLLVDINLPDSSANSSPTLTISKRICGLVHGKCCSMYRSGSRIFWKGPGLYAFITFQAWNERRRWRDLLGGLGNVFYLPSKTPFPAFLRLEQRLWSQDINSGVYLNSQPENQNFLYSPGWFWECFVIIILMTLEYVFSENVSFIFSFLDRDMTIVNIYL